MAMYGRARVVAFWNYLDRFLSQMLVVVLLVSVFEKKEIFQQLHKQDVG